MYTQMCVQRQTALVMTTCKPQFSSHLEIFTLKSPSPCEASLAPQNKKRFLSGVVDIALPVLKLKIASR